MIYKELKKSVEEIKMSDEMKNRIIKNCYIETANKEEYSMRKTNNNFKIMLPRVAVLVLCLMTSVVVANHLRGPKDITKGTAIVGTIFEESADMIKLDSEIKNNLVVSANVVEYNAIPYSEIDTLNINSYKIVNNDGNVVAEGTAKSVSAFENGKVTFEIPLNNVTSGNYKLVINEFVGLAKADQPLLIKGIWECTFDK